MTSAGAAVSDAGDARRLGAASLSGSQPLVFLRHQRQCSYAVDHQHHHYHDNNDNNNMIIIQCNYKQKKKHMQIKTCGG